MSDHDHDHDHARARRLMAGHMTFVSLVLSRVWATSGNPGVAHGPERAR